jgi:cullin 1
LKTAFEHIMNTDVGNLRNAEYLAAFCDRLLKKGGEKLSEEQVETRLENIVQLFSYLNDKDLFSDIYRNFLSKRLLNQKSANDDAEKSMIGKLKLKCGAQFTSKMEGMLNDLSTGKDHLEKFQQFIKDKDKDLNNVEFSVQVLTTGFWPKNVETKLQLPTSMDNCVKAFSEYYNSATEARKLYFVESLGSCNVQMQVGKKKYDLSVTTLQAATLDMFSVQSDGSLPEHSLEEVVASLQLEEKFCKKILHSLSCGKYKVLVKTPKSKKISTGDRFTASTKFSNNSRKLRIPMASLQPSHDSKRVEDDRTVAIEAAIVRIMKTRKQMKHTGLVGEVLKQLQFFRPQPKSVKRCIERLIDREYLERDENESSMYRYLA